MQIWIVLFLPVARSTTHAVTLVAQAARNLKNCISYGGARGPGDGLHDDWQAFLPASLIIIFSMLLPTMGAV